MTNRSSKKIRIKYLCKNVFAGGTPDTSNMQYWNGNIPWIASGALQNCDVNEPTSLITKKGLNESSTKMVKKHTALIAMTGATCANVGYSTIDACYNQSVCSFINKKNVSARYLYYALIAERKTILSNQFGGAQAGINVQECKDILIPNKDIYQQKKVVDFLDREIPLIDKIIETLERQIEELKEYKLNLITEYITHGTETNLVNSSLQWQRKVPEKWKMIRIKDHTYLKGRIGWQGLRYDDFIEEGPYCITGTDFNTDSSINWDTCYHVSEKRYQMDKAIQVKNGDLLITKDGTVGKLAFVDSLPDKACLNSHLLIIRVNDNSYRIKFLYYVLKSRLLSEYLNIKKNGTVMDSLTQDMLENFRFYVPTLDIQDNIINVLNDKVSKLEKLINLKNRKLYEYKKYKESLIYEVVYWTKEVN